MAAKKERPPSAAARGKAAQDSIPSRTERIAAFKDRFNKANAGHGQIKLASEYVLPYLTKRLPTGLLSLDIELRGGLPAGGLSQFAGPKNSCKSYLYWQVIRQLQFILGDNMKVLLAMTEMRADRQQARLAGVKIALADEDIASFNRARVKDGRPPFSDEEIADMKFQIGSIDELHGESAEILYDGILEAVELNAYHLIIIDSFGSIMSGAEAESQSLQEKQYGGAAGVNTKFLRKLTALLTIDDGYGKPRDVCLIGVNQIRANIGGGPYKEFKTTGGHSLDHAKFVDIWLESGAMQSHEEPVYTSNGTKKRFVQTGKEINWKIEKGKAGLHEGGKGSFIYGFDTNQADFYLDTLVAGIRLGIIETAGAWIGIKNPDNPDEYLMRANGKDAFIAAMVEDVKAKEAFGDHKTILNYIRNQAFKAKDISIDYEWSLD